MLEGLDIVYKAVLLSGFVFSAISGLFFLVMNSRYVSKKTMDEHVETETKEFEKIKERLDAGAQEFTKINARMSELPTKDQIHDLSNAITALGGELKAIKAGVAGLESQFNGLATTVTALVNNELGKQK